jgi:hypothetical protein
MRLAYEASKPGIGNVGYEEWLEKISDVENVCSACGQPMGDDPDSHVCTADTEGGGGAEGPTPGTPSPLDSSG